jgi:glyoxylase-like metal-dependent hydrolase (beta-lactamase superfamily II)
VTEPSANQGGANQGGASELSLTLSVGDLRILALSDGEFTMPRDFLSSPEAHDALAGHDGLVHMPVGCFLFPGDQPVLVDLGFGPGPGNNVLTGGNLLNQLRRSGHRPEEIEIIAITHPHPDHIGWLATADGQQHFPRARLLLATADWDYFIGQQQGEMDDHIRVALEELYRQGRLELLSGQYAVTPHITALPAPGHTPGHTVFAVHDHGERAVLLGDSIYCPQQLGHADWEAVSDVDPLLAARTRRTLERDLEQHAALAVGAHFPGLVAARVLQR